MAPGDQLNPNAHSRRSSATGAFQYEDGSWRDSDGDRRNVADATNRAAQDYTQNTAFLRRHLGREPEAWEAYLAHQQGAAGAAALLSHPNAKATAVLAPYLGSRRAERAVLDNGGSPDMTAGELAEHWRQIYQRAANAPR